MMFAVRVRLRPNTFRVVLLPRSSIILETSCPTPEVPVSRLLVGKGPLETIRWDQAIENRRGAALLGQQSAVGCHHSAVSQNSS